MRLLIILCLAVLAPQFAWSASFDTQQRNETLVRIADLIEAHYVHADAASETADEIRGWVDDPALMQTADQALFASLVSERLRKRDGHFSLTWSDSSEQSDDLESNSAIPPEDFSATLPRRNYGFESVKRLPGNIGYLKLNFFAGFDPDAPETPAPRRTAEAAMAFLEDTNAMIIDLRQNGGGAPAMVHLILSHFLSEKPLLINKFYERDGDRTIEFYSFDRIANKRRSGAPLYVLTSGRTGSAAEEFAYDVETHKLGTIVGETTIGAANPGETFDAGGGFTIFISTGAAVNPVTGTNWEGAGVTPQIAVPAEEAFDRAYELALNAVVSDKHLSRYEQREAQWVKKRRAAEQAGAALSRAEMKKYAGQYGDREIMLENNSLYYKRGRRPKYPLVSLGDGLFALSGIDDETQVKFDHGPDGKVRSMTIESVAGNISRVARNESA